MTGRGLICLCLLFCAPGSALRAASGPEDGTGAKDPAFRSAAKAGQLSVLPPSGAGFDPATLAAIRLKLSGAPADSDPQTPTAQPDHSNGH